MVSAPQPDGRVPGFHEFGVLVFSMTILIQNLKILTFSSSFYIANVVIIILSVGLFQLSFYVVNTWESDEYFGLFQQ